VRDLDGFWQSIWDYFGIESPTPHGRCWPRTDAGRALVRRRAGELRAPGVAPRRAAHAAGFPAIISRNEKGEHRELSWPELRRQVASLALHLKAQGLQPGDRVAAYLPNMPEAMVAFLAVVSLGGVWSICAPDMGTNAVLDRFRQIEPKVLIACDGVTTAARTTTARVVAELRAALPSVRHVLVHCATSAARRCSRTTWLRDAMARDGAEVDAFEPMWLPFDHPLWIVYSSGTTGLPKPIVHGHGGVLVMLALKCCTTTSAAATTPTPGASASTGTAPPAG
jgi:acetoacetyl-CoA synthetase